MWYEANHERAFEVVEGALKLTDTYLNLIFWRRSLLSTPCSAFGSQMTDDMYNMNPQMFSEREKDSEGKDQPFKLN